MDQWHNKTGPIYDKDAESSALSAGFSDEHISSASRRKRLLRKSPEATIDLHGLTRDEAWNALTVFFDDAKNKGLEKVLIIHGKGNHNAENHDDGGVLKKLTRQFVEHCPFAGESGYSNSREGGEGSSWVLLKESQINVPGR